MTKTTALLALVTSLLVARDDKEDLVAAAKKTAESKSYSFKGTTTRELPEQARNKPAPQNYEGKRAEAGTLITTDRETVVYAKGRIATCPKPEWRARDDRAGRPPAEGDQPPRQGGAGALLAGLAALVPPRPPHEEIAKLGDMIDSAAKRADAETLGEYPCKVYDVVFTKDAARAMLGGGAGRRPGGGGGQNPLANAEISAKGVFWVNDDGRIIQAEATVTVALTIQNNAVEAKTIRKLSLFDFDKTTLEIPEEAMKAIDAKGE